MIINKNFLYLTLSASFLFLIYTTSFASANQVNSDFYQDQKNCVNQGGAWRQFSNNCAGNCFSKLEKFSICGQVLTFGCDCGSDYCWNKDKCVKDIDYQEEIKKNAKKVSFSKKNRQEEDGKEKNLENKNSKNTKIEDVVEQGKNLRKDIMANIVNDSMERAKSIYDSDKDGQEKIKKEIEKRNIKAKNFQQNAQSPNIEDADGKKSNSNGKSSFGSMFASDKKQEIKHSQGNNLRDIYESLNLYQDNKNNNNKKDESVIDNIFSDNDKKLAETDKKNQNNNTANDNKGLFSFLFDKDDAKKEVEKMDIPLPVETNQNDKNKKDNKEIDSKKSINKEESGLATNNKNNINNKNSVDNKMVDTKNPPKLEDFVIPN